MKNIEIKTKYPNQKSAMEIAEKIGAEYMGIINQEDIYFKISQGGLKLRIINNEDYELIYYKRANVKSAKESIYEIFRVKNGKELISVLKNILHVSVIVKKKRELYIYENVRIHIDTVKEMGKFLEFEAVCRNSKDVKKAHVQIKKLISEYKISQKDLIKLSYSDLLLNKKNFII